MAGGLVLPEHVARERAAEPPVPTCTVCGQPLETGDPIVSIVAAVEPGMLHLVAAHLSCVLKVGEEKEVENDGVHPKGD